TARHACQARLSTQIEWQIPNLSGRQSHLEAWEFPQYDGRFIRKKHSVPGKQNVRTGIRLIARHEGHLMFQWRRNDIQAIFINLAEHERADKIHVRNAPKAIAEITE